MREADEARPDHDLAKALGEFALLLQRDHDVQEIFDLLGDYCTQLLPVRGAGILLARDAPSDLVVVTANTAEGRRVEELETQLQEGPCHDAIRSGRQMLATDLHDERDRYPRFVPMALDAGIRSIHALPMATWEGDIVASLDLVSMEPLALSRSEVSAAQLLADVALSYVINWTLRHRSSTLADQLQTALHSRVTIEQAKGILAERHAESVDEAFDRLRSYARSNGAKLREVASAVVDRRLDP